MSVRIPGTLLLEGNESVNRARIATFLLRRERTKGSAGGCTSMSASVSNASQGNLAKRYRRSLFFRPPI